MQNKVESQLSVEIIFLKRHKTNNDLIITKPWLKIAKCNYFADGEIGENVGKFLMPISKH